MSSFTLQCARTTQKFPAQSRHSKEYIWVFRLDGRTSETDKKIAVTPSRDEKNRAFTEFVTLQRDLSVIRFQVRNIHVKFKTEKSDEQELIRTALSSNLLRAHSERFISNNVIN